MTFTQLAEVSIPFVIVGCVLAGFGQALALVIGDSSHPLARFWRRTAPLHPILLGALLGFAELPVPEPMGEGTAARMLWYCGAGVFSALTYKYVNRAMEKKLP